MIHLIWTASWQAGILALLVWATVLAAGRRLPPAWRHALWLIPLSRLLILELPPNPFSFFQWMPAPEAVVVQVWTDHNPLPPKATDVAVPVGSSHINPAQVLAIGWMAGFALFLAGLMIREWRGHRMIWQLPPVEDPRIQALLGDGLRSFGLKNTPRMCLSQDGTPAGVAGILQPTLVLSREVLEMPDSSLRHVLWHELAHLRRKDLWILQLGQIACAIHWFNPAAWWIWRELKRTCEPATDALALRYLEDGELPAYAETLVALLEGHPHQSASMVTGLGENGKRLQERIRDILAHRPVFYSLAGALLLAAIAGLGLGGKGAAPKIAAPQNSKPPGYSVQQSAENNKLQTTTLVKITSRIIGFPEQPGLESHRIFKPEKAAEFLKELGSRKGVEILTAPTVISNWGRQSTVSVAREFIYPKTFKTTKEGSPMPDEFTSTNIGLTLNFTAKSKPTLIEIDYDLMLRDLLGMRVLKAGMQAPVFSERSIKTTLQIPSGCSLLLQLPDANTTGFTDQSLVKMEIQNPAPVNGQTVYALLTATIINSDGEPKKTAPPPAYTQNSMHVSAVNSAHHFVILDRGSAQGVNEFDLYGIRRNDRQIALVKVASVETGSSIAEILSESIKPGPGDGASYPEGILTKGKDRAHSPYAPNAGEIDLSGIPRGTQVKCPYTRKIMLAP